MNFRSTLINLFCKTRISLRSEGDFILLLVSISRKTIGLGQLLQFCQNCSCSIFLNNCNPLKNVVKTGHDVEMRSNCGEKDVGNNCGGGNWRGPGTGGKSGEKGKNCVAGKWNLGIGKGDVLCCAGGVDVRMHVHLTT